MCNINDNAVQGHLSENYLTQSFYCMKYFRHKIFAIYGILIVVVSVIVLLTNKLNLLFSVEIFEEYQ